MFKVLLGLVALAVIAFVLLRPRADISGAEARQLVSGGAVLVDVRTVEEFEAAHIDGALNLPVDELQSRLDEVGDKSGRVVVYCRSGMRSSRAKSILQDAGFTSVQNMGGMGNW